ncbi:MmcQ/YjbR family DNA-binding protein [Zeaxanthinibacter sp. PT1]|uniref:MmcQ/YjbR family DNA-binding protein n=1 Tax=Zeaxanthinibacter TaxID=561554 RepID=UPI00234BBD7F|nr:MmcQ/YjbR family DNA-binding protein [Zeaxanthinibacter sp. PT1]MDC6350946.1 MmcQ/YjbR family DNA-binding protein [Zeaxanthinibacter sp. PT1]
MNKLKQYPQYINYPVKITMENEERQYDNVRRMIKTLNIIIILTFWGIVLGTVKVARGEAEGLGIEQFGKAYFLKSTTFNIDFMVTEETFKKLALSFPGTEERPHFERIGYRVVGKRMFATFLDIDNSANIFLSPEEQKVFCSIDSKNIYPIPNKWGEQGATTFVLKEISKDIVLEALLSAYSQILNPNPKNK